MSMETATGRANVTPYEAYYTVASNTVRNVITAGIGTLFLWWFSGIWALGAKIGFWIAAVLTALEGIHALVGAGLTVALNVAGQRRPGEGWMIAASVVQLLGEAVAVALLFFLWSKLWL